MEALPGQQIHLFELKAISSDVNVAIDGIATQSSTYKNNEAKFGPNNAIDDNVIGTFQHTNDANAWLEVALSTPAEIDAVEIYNRYCGSDPTNDPKQCLCRLSGATLTLLDSSNSVISSVDLGDTCGKTVIEQVYVCALPPPPPTCLTRSIKVEQTINS